MALATEVPEPDEPDEPGPDDRHWSFPFNPDGEFVMDSDVGFSGGEGGD